MKSKMSECLILLLCTVTVVNSLTRYDSFACFDRRMRKYFCCANYQEINGICVECNIGFMSRKGQACEQCALNLFGEGCAHECLCNGLQRCDHVKGCVDVGTLKTLSTTESISLEQTTMDKKDEENDGISKTQLLMLYSGTSSVIIIILGVLGILYCFNKRLLISKSKPINTNENTIHEVTTSTRHVEEETVEMADNLYETIDESTLENIVVPNEYNPESTPDRCVDRSSYLYPYNTKTVISKHNQQEMLLTKTLTLNTAESRFGQCSCNSDKEEDEDSSSYESTRDCNDDRSSYLQPYCSLDTNISDCHIYDEKPKDQEV